jgi:glycosyltransferase involved in cell wall biosynthesis
MAQGGRDWAGGLELTKNIIRATTLFCDSISREVEFHVFGEKPEASAPIAMFETSDNVVWQKTPAIPAPGLTHRILQKLTRGQVSSVGQQEVLQSRFVELGLDFVYPFPKKLGGEQPATMSWIPDLQHCRLPEHFSDDELEKRNRIFTKMGMHSAAIVFSSNNAKSDYEEFFPDIRCQKHVLPFRVVLPSELEDTCPISTASKYSLPNKFLLVCGQLWSHKNHMLLLEAIAEVKERLPEVCLAVTGRLSDFRHPEYVDQFLSRIHEMDLNREVRVLGLVPKLDQLNLMRSCQTLVQPSLFEGWSTVVEEAHALGCPSILSDLEVHKEQSPPNCCFFERENFHDLAVKIHEAWHTEYDRNTDGAKAKTNYHDLVIRFGSNFLDLATCREREVATSSG